MSGDSAASGPEPGDALSARHHDPETVAVPGGEKPEGGRRGQHQVPFLTGCGAEVEAGGPVSDDPRLHFPVGVGRAHMGGQGPGRQIPVHTAGVVARLVRPGARRLGPRPGGYGQVVTGQDAVEPAESPPAPAVSRPPPWPPPPPAGPTGGRRLAHAAPGAPGDWLGRETSCQGAKGRPSRSHLPATPQGEEGMASAAVTRKGHWAARAASSCWGAIRGSGTCSSTRRTTSSTPVPSARAS